MKNIKIKVLNGTEIRNIHNAVISILENVGVFIEEEELLNIFYNNKFNVDFQKHIVKISEIQIEKILNKINKNILIYGRDREKYANLSSNKLHASSGFDPIYFYDYDNKKRVKITRKEVGNLAKISDFLEHIDILGTPGMPQDVKPEKSITFAAFDTYKNTTKPVCFGIENFEQVKIISEMVKIILESEDISKEPIFSILLSPISPLKWTKNITKALIELSKLNIPVIILPQPISGVTAPYTIAGLLTMNTAEVISGAIIYGLFNKRINIVYGSSWTTMNMLSGSVVIASPETVLARMAGSEIAHYYNLPYRTIGIDTDSNIYDEQMGFEKMITCFCSMMSGSNIFDNAGMFQTGYGTSYEQLIIDNEIIKFSKRIRNGIEVNAETIARDLISEIGPGGNFITSGHTIKFMRTDEHFKTDIINREPYELWKNGGMKTIMDNANKKAKDILKDYKPSQLEGKKINAIEKLLTN